MAAAINHTAIRQHIRTLEDNVESRRSVAVEASARLFNKHSDEDKSEGEAVEGLVVVMNLDARKLCSEQLQRTMMVSRWLSKQFSHALLYLLLS